MGRGLLVDFGGVLTSSVLDSFAEFARSEGIDPDVLARVMRQMIVDERDNLFHRVEIGEIDTDEFERLFAEQIGDRCGVPLESAGLKSRLFAAAGADEEMLDVLRVARSHGVKTALVSNSWGVTDGGYPIHMFDELFDATIISGEVRLRKPGRQIFLLAAERVGLEPRECIFVDDFQVNVEGARAVGMAAILHREAARTIPELEAFLGVPLRRAT